VYSQAGAKSDYENIGPANKVQPQPFWGLWQQKQEHLLLKGLEVMKVRKVRMLSPTAKCFLLQLELQTVLTSLASMNTEENMPNLSRIQPHFGLKKLNGTSLGGDFRPASLADRLKWEISSGFQVRSLT